MSTQRLLLIDGHSLAYRAFFALPVENFSTSTGQTTNAVYGFISMLLKACDTEAPTHLAVAFDAGRDSFRFEEYPDYKAGRAKTPPEFHGQVELIKDVLAALDVPVFVSREFEADDVLATLTRLGCESDAEVLLASGDKDSFQLASDAVTILYPKRGLSDLARMTPQAVEEKYSVTPANYRGLAALVGEKADNLPGVPGVGEKTAAKWLTAYGDLPGVLEHAQEIKGKAGESLRAHAEDVERNYRLNRLVDDVDLDFDFAASAIGGADEDRVNELFDQLEFRAFAARVASVFDVTHAKTQSPEISIPTTSSIDPDDLAAWIRARDAAAVVGVLTDADPSGAEGEHLVLAQGDDVVAVALSALPQAAFDAVDELFTNHPLLVAHDAKPQIKAFVQGGFAQPAFATDTQLAAYLLVPDQRSFDIDDLARQHLGLELGTEHESGTLELDDADSSVQRLGRRAWVLQALADTLREALQEAGLTSVLDDIEVPVQTILARMELAGIAVDEAGLSDLIDLFSSQADELAQQAYADIGKEINLGSPKQLQTVLFDELGMPKTKRTKTGYTTDADALTDLLVSSPHPFLEHLLGYRDSVKLKQTVVGLEKVVGDDDRIHTTYLQTVAATGRLSSKDPNLQNIPVRTDAGRRIRSVFVPGATAGFDELLSADYSQIEMRIMAHLSGDEALIRAFNDGEDLHSFVAGQVFGVTPDQVDSPMRSKVKAMSYGLVYGLSAYGLSKQLRIGVDEAKALMDTYFERFGAVRDYLEGIVAEARGRGYTETMYGRRRYLPQLTSDRRQLREMAERAALNAPIQGSAADIMKIAMLAVDDALRSNGFASRLLLQVHDEVIVEVARGESEAVSQAVSQAMSGAASLSVPLDVNVGIGSNWQSAAH